MKNLYFITGNKGKVLEAKSKLSDLNINIIQKDLGYPEIQANSLEDVAIFGADYIQKKFKHPFILEDAGLFIDELNGFPGVFSAYVFYKIGCSGILNLLKNLDDTKRKATFRSIYAYGKPSKNHIIIAGECHGKISKKALGDQGFGYDPIFIPNDETKTFAQMKTEEKNQISHRGKALEKLKNLLINSV